jgi:hypothetical protein
MGHRARVGLAALVVLSAAACKKPQEQQSAPSVTQDAGPVDHLAPREIAEGRFKAYSLTLPLDSNIRYHLTDVFEIESRLTPEQLSNYVRAHVRTEKITAGAQRTTFDEAIVPSEPKRVLRIEITPARADPVMASLMLIHDITPLPAPAKISDEDAWKKAGRLPNGKLDPSQNY